MAVCNQVLLLYRFLHPLASLEFREILWPQQLLVEEAVSDLIDVDRVIVLLEVVGWPIPVEASLTDVRRGHL